MIHRPFRLEQPHGLIRGDVRVPEGPPPRTAVLVVHGFKGYKDWAFFPWLAERLVGDRHAVVSFNMTGSGIGSDPHAFTDLEGFRANTYSRELSDVAAVLETLAGDLLPRVPDRIGLLGHSRGGADAVLTASERSGIDALVTWAAVAELDRWTAETRAAWREHGVLYVLNSRTGQQMPLGLELLEDFEASRDRFDVLAAASRVAAPWLIVHGGADETVPPDHARRLARACPGSRLCLVDGAGHTFDARHPFPGPNPRLQEALAATRRHFRLHLRPD